MIIKYKKKNLCIDQFKLKCCIGKAGIKKIKFEGDKSTPSGTFRLGNFFLRGDRIKNIETNIRKIKISKNMGWCNDSRSKKYNRLFVINKKEKFKYEKMFRNDHKYNMVIPILYNYYETKKNKGSAIFIHLTKNYKPTSGCIGLIEKDFRILLKLIKKNTKIKI